MSRTDQLDHLRQGMLLHWLYDELTRMPRSFDEDDPRDVKYISQAHKRIGHLCGLIVDNKAVRGAFDEAGQGLREEMIREQD